MTPRIPGRKEVSAMAKPMYFRFEMPKDLVDKTYQSIELAKESGKVRKGTNEVTKLVERGEAQFVVMAEDVQPEEILAHMPLLCEDRKSTRLNSSHPSISYAVFCLKKKKKIT